MNAYLDSSFLFSMYATDDNSVAADAELRRYSGKLLLSSLSELELFNALELRIFRKQLSRAEVDKAQAAFESDLERGILQIVDLDEQTFLRTRKLIVQYSSSIGCRTADTLHVAAALQASANRLFTFDIRQKELAQTLNLPTN